MSELLISNMKNILRLQKLVMDGTLKKEKIQNLKAQAIGVLQRFGKKLTNETDQYDDGDEDEDDIDPDHIER